MIKYLSKYFAGVSPMFIDGTLYALIALFAFLGTFFGSEDAAQYVHPVWLFWVKGIIGSLSAFLLAIKLFRSTSFADHQESKRTGNTEFIAKPEKKD